MPRIPIHHITLTPSGRIQVAPALPAAADYAQIHRAGMSVRWDAATRTLYSLPVPGWTPLQEFHNIVAIVKSEYGDRLITDPQTTFSNVPPDLETAIRAHPA